MSDSCVVATSEEVPTADVEETRGTGRLQVG